MRKNRLDILGLESKMMIKRISIIVSVLFLVSCNQKNTKINVYNAEKIFSEFKMTQDYAKDLDEFKLDVSKGLDHLEVRMDSLNLKLGKTISKTEKIDLEKSIKLLSEKYTSALDVFESSMQSKINEGDQVIWKRLALYSEAYAKQHDIQLMVNVSMTNQSLYYDKSMDVTEDLITYVNDKYEVGD